MKSIKPILIIALTFFVQLLFAQTFTEVLDTPFEGVYFSAIAFADVDGDNDEDVLIVGVDADGDASAKFYLNEAGEFIEVTDTPFMAAGAGAVAFADVDGDNDLDVLISGDDDSGDPFAKLYTNDAGVFTEVMDTPFEGGEGGSIDFSDIDGDDDLDVFIVGESAFSGPNSRLYTNEGGVFTEVIDANISNVYFGDNEFADVDGDGDEDLLIAGLDDSESAITKLYKNNGGDFTEVPNTPFIGLGAYSALAFSDIDGDGDPDVLIAGFIEGEEEAITRLYVNDGGVFAEMMDTPFADLVAPSIAFADVDGDNDSDVLISGVSLLDSTFVSKLYTNEGGVFTEVEGTPFDGVTVGSIAFSDVDGDNDQDVLITGFNLGVHISKLYTNDGLGTFVEERIENLSIPFEIYPNPSVTDEVNISITSKENCGITVTVLDMNGRRLQRQQEILFTGEQTFSIDISLLSKGSYVIQLDDDKRRSFRKLLVQ